MKAEAFILDRARLNAELAGQLVKHPPSQAARHYSEDAVSFRAHELAKADEVMGALTMYSQTLAKPHRQ